MSFKSTLSLAAAALLFLAGCTGEDYQRFQNVEANSASVGKGTPSFSMENKIMPHDRLLINIYNQSGMQGGQLSSILSSSIGMTQNVNLTQSNATSLLVTPEGTVHLPLIGWVKLAGLTQSEATQKLTKAYQKYLRKPYVSVDVVNHRVFVVGDVNKPGVVMMNDGVMSLMEAIARSGDLKDTADRTVVKIIEGGSKNPRVRVVDLAHISAAGISSLYLRPNDIVYVQPRYMKGFNRDVNEFLVPFDAISRMLSPFVQIKVLTDD